MVKSSQKNRAMILPKSFVFRGTKTMKVFLRYRYGYSKSYIFIDVVLLTLAMQKRCFQGFFLCFQGFFLSFHSFSVCLQEYFSLFLGVLLRLTRVFTPAEFLQLLPKDGAVQFFLPYLSECSEYHESTKLKQHFLDTFKTIETQVE